MNEFESSLENVFFDQVLKRLPRTTPFETQVNVSTLCGTFRLDMLATVEGRRIGLEVDGQEFHDEYRDEWRDAMILGDGQADEIIRLRGCDLVYHLDDCQFLLSKIQPLLFCERQLAVTERFASERAKRFAEGETDWQCGALLSYTEQFFIDIRRRTIEGRVTGPGREFWAVYHRFATEQGGGPLDTIIERWRATDRAAWSVP